MKAVASRNSHSARLARLCRLMLLLALASCGGGGDNSDAGLDSMGVPPLLAPSLPESPPRQFDH